jgi:ATP-dependent DNA helicase RecQ
MPFPLAILQSTFGFPAFCGRQAEVIDRVMAEQRTLANLRRYA